MMSMLSDIGIPDHKVGASPHLADALALVSKWRPDCVLLDLTLPDASGVEAVEAIVAAIPNVPVIVVSASDDPNIALAAVKAGAQEFMSKWPADAEDFAALVRIALARRIATPDSGTEAASAVS